MKERISFTEQIRIALSKPSWYRSLFEQPIGKHIGYFAVLLALITVIQFVIPVAAYLQSVGGLKELIMERIPTFVLDDGKLTMDETVDMERDDVQLIIDTSVDAYSPDEARQLANDRDAALVYMVRRTNVVSNANPLPLSFSGFQDITFDNQDLYQMAPIYLGIYGMMTFLSNILTYGLSALFFACFGYLLSRALQLQLKFGQIYGIALYAKSLEILLESVLQVSGISILYYIGSVIGIFVTCNYMTRGMTSLMRPSA